MFLLGTFHQLETATQEHVSYSKEFKYIMLQIDYWVSLQPLLSARKYVQWMFCQHCSTTIIFS